MSYNWLCVVAVQSDMHDLIETRMADEIARDRQRSVTGPRHDTLMSSPTSKKRFFLRWTWRLSMCRPPAFLSPSPVPSVCCGCKMRWCCYIFLLDSALYFIGTSHPRQMTFKASDCGSCSSIICKHNVSLLDIIPVNVGHPVTTLIQLVDWCVMQNFDMANSFFSWWRGTVVERRSLAGELSLSCAQPAADGWPLMWVNHPLWVSQLSQLSLSSFLGQ